MSDVINYFKNSPDWEGAIITKLCCDSKVPVDHRIFALAKAGFTSDSLMVRLWSFEVKTGDDVKLIWNVFNSQGEKLTAEVKRDGEFSLSVKGDDLKDKLICYIITGEDLQGEYWGCVMSVPFSVVLPFLKKESINSVDKISMEFIREKEYQSLYKGNFKLLLEK